MMQSFAITALVTVLWMVVGYSLAFARLAALTSFIGGLDKAVPERHGRECAGRHAGANIPESVFMIFQMTFAIITPALIVGAFAERMKFSAMLWFMGIWSLVVYAPIAHWVWAATAAGCWRPWACWTSPAAPWCTSTPVSPAWSRPSCWASATATASEPMAPHNLVLTVIGASMLWVGWFGFNAGSAVAADGRAGMAMAVTQIATAAAALAWMFAEWMAQGQASRAGHRLRRGRRPGRHHPGLRLRRPDGRAGHRPGRRRGLLPGARPSSSACSATTTRSTSSACTASAVSSAPC